MNGNACIRWGNEAPNYTIPHLRLRTVANLINGLRPCPKAYADLGCAEGLLSKLTPNIRYVGIDFVRPQHVPEFEFYQCDLNTGELPSVLADVDLVTCSGILEYVEDLPGFFAKLKSRTRPNTKVVASYFNMNHASRVCRLLAGSTLNTHPDWRNFLSPRDLQSLMAKAGFRIDRVVPVGLSLGNSPPVRDTVSQIARVHQNFPGSYLLAHQFVFVLTK